ncbi:Zn-dependent hydrolase [Congregibacter litoralis KT71]|uniref:Zn-dependent hydrolase n=2 Tax=Congregibacter TaxID=393661 RepID=A4A4Y0_9GAMM|nr:Zn-dependent hydrolase [Congregibacter litoralis KT71]
MLKAGIASAVALATLPVTLRGTNAAALSKPVVAESSFARIVEVGDGVFAVVSTPLDSAGNFATPQTLCNGGLVVGDERILSVDGYYQPEGAAWVNEQAKKLFGRPVSDVICTHLHLDHTGGLAGFQDGATGPEIYMTARTWAMMVDQYSSGTAVDGTSFLAPPARLVGPTRVIDDESQSHTLDLGGRSVTILPLGGHTPSDLAILVDDLPITFGGDLAWWGLFPNYVDAVPSKLAGSVETLMSGGSRLMVTGHGGLVSTDDMAPYAELIASIDSAALQARERGWSPEKAGEVYKMPASTADWGFFNPRYPERAVAAWYREWGMATP